jgi:5'-nucleotidase
MAEATQLDRKLSDEGAKPRVLVTNDDGVDSAGIAVLADAAAAHGLTVQIVAPCRNSRGASASLTAVTNAGRISIERGHIGSLPRVQVLGVDSAPAFIVRSALYGAFGPPPDLVLSGVNRGPNTGRAVLHSGTVGAALTAAVFGRRALAISADVGDPPTWDAASAVAGLAIGWLLHAPDVTVLNVNVPNRDAGELRGFVPATLAPVGTVQGNVVGVDGSSLPVTFEDLDPSELQGTDAGALSDGYVSVTALRPLGEDDRLDLPALLT